MGAAHVQHEPVVADRESKSLSHETTFEHDTGDRASIEHVLRGFLTTLARELRQEDLAAASVTIKLKDARFNVTTKHRRFPRPLNYDPDMWLTIKEGLNELMKPGSVYRLAGLAVTALTPASSGLFDGRRGRAIEAMDAIIARHGAGVMGLGGVTRTDDE